MGALRQLRWTDRRGVIHAENLDGLQTLGTFRDFADDACALARSLELLRLRQVTCTDAAAANGASIEVFWYYDREDDTMQELGEEFGEDLVNAKFHLEKMAE